MTCLLKPGYMAISDLMSLGPKLGHAFGQIALSRQHTCDLADDVFAFFGVFLQQVGLLAELSEP